MSGAQTSTDPTVTTTETTTPPAVGSVTEKSDATTALGAGLASTTSVDPAKTETPPTGAPEKYGDWKLPEGYALDTGVSEDGSKLFKELNLTQDQAQKLVDFYSEHAIRSSKEVLDAWTATRKEWRECI